MYVAADTDALRSALGHLDADVREYVLTLVRQGLARLGLHDDADGRLHPVLSLRVDAARGLVEDFE